MHVGRIFPDVPMYAAEIDRRVVVQPKLCSIFVPRQQAQNQIRLHLNDRVVIVPLEMTWQEGMPAGAARQRPPGFSGDRGVGLAEDFNRESIREVGNDTGARYHNPRIRIGYLPNCQSKGHRQLVEGDASRGIEQQERGEGEAQAADFVKSISARLGCYRQVDGEQREQGENRQNAGRSGFRGEEEIGESARDK